MNNGSSCTCPDCRTLCTRFPGWMTPAEASAAIDAGLAGKLMRDWWEPDSTFGNDEPVYVLAPAAVGCEGEDAPEMPETDFITALFSDWVKGCCTFLTKDRLCEIHESGFKPIACRLTFACNGINTNHRSHEASNFQVARLWDTDDGRRVVERWQEAVR